MINVAPIGGGVEIAYAVTGEGPPLVLMHGAEADHTQYAALTSHLAGRFTYIAYDQRDSGQTRNPEAPYGIEALADDAAALIAALGHQRAHVFGSSLGSVIAQALAVRHPGRVDRLVLSAAIRIGKSIAEINPEAAATLGRLRADPAANAARIAGWFYPEAHLAAHPELARRFGGGTRTPAQRARRNPDPGGAAARSRRHHRADPGAGAGRGPAGSAGPYAGDRRGNPGCAHHAAGGAGPCRNDPGAGTHRRRHHALPAGRVAPARAGAGCWPACSPCPRSRGRRAGRAGRCASSSPSRQVGRWSRSTASWRTG
ncbi:alpha/beta fold hydrolase [Siccirubricoccus deserti]